MVMHHHEPECHTLIQSYCFAMFRVKVTVWAHMNYNQNMIVSAVSHVIVSAVSHVIVSAVSHVIKNILRV